MCALSICEHEQQIPTRSWSQLNAAIFYLQAVQHAKQARLNDAFAANLGSLTQILSLIALPLLALVFAAMSAPRLTMADLLMPPILPARAVVTTLLAAALAVSVACFVVSRSERTR